MRVGRRLGYGMVWLALALPLVAFGERYGGEVEVLLSTMPTDQPTHGYAAAIARVANQGTKRERTVRLTLVGRDAGSSRLRSVSREVRVGPGTETNVLLPIPASLPGDLTECLVAVDGREQMPTLPLRFATAGGLGSMYRAPALQILVSRGTSYDAMEQALAKVSRGVVNYSLERSDRDIEAWPGRWIAYSAYDAVTITAPEWTQATETVRDALWRYTECGGMLVVCGPFSPPASGAKAGSPGGMQAGGRLEVGFGLCLVAHRAGISPEVAGALMDRAQRNQNQVWSRYTSAGSSHDAAPVVSEVKLPLALALGVLVLFALVAGPVSMAVLRRANRSIWLFWVTPALGLFTSVLILLSMLLGEGVTASVRVAGITVLDERVGRATSLAINGFYCPLRPRQGLLYSYDTEVTLGQVESDAIFQQPTLEVSWDEGQRLTGDWVPSRVPTYLRLRSSELRSERLGTVRGEGKGLAAVNGLGTAIRHLILMDFDGTIYEAKDVPAGAQTDPLEVSSLVVPNPRSLADAVLWAEQWTEDRQSQLPWNGILRPGSYLAFLDGAPFLPDGLPGSAKRQEDSVVFGLMREEGQQ